MKRALLFIFMTVCVLGMSACSSKDAMPETSDSASNPVQNTDISNLNGGKIWSEQDISYEDWKPPGKVKKPKPRQKSPEEQFQEAKNRCFRILADYLHLLMAWRTDYAPHSPEEAFHPRFVEALQKQAQVEYLLDPGLSQYSCVGWDRANPFLPAALSGG